MTCNKGVIHPSNIHCETGMRKSRQELLPESKENEGGVEQTNDLDTSDMDEGSNSTDVTEETKMCGPPSISDGALVYR